REPAGRLVGQLQDGDLGHAQILAADGPGQGQDDAGESPPGELLEEAVQVVSFHATCNFIQSRIERKSGWHPRRRSSAQSSGGGPIAAIIVRSWGRTFSASILAAEASIFLMVGSNSARGAFCPGLAGFTQRSGLMRATT